MMTTMAALLGAVPVALGYGAGGESRRPLGLAVVGGLLFSQLITLYLTPVVYTYMAAVLEWSRRRKHQAAELPARACGAIVGADLTVMRHDQFYVLGSDVLRTARVSACATCRHNKTK